MGTQCIGADSFVRCSGLGCCSVWCSLHDPEPPCSAGQRCVSWYVPGRAPAGYEAVGVCAVPQ